MRFSILKTILFLTLITQLTDAFAEELGTSSQQYTPPTSPQKYKSKFFGSNISSTTQTLAANDTTVGFQITGYGINDKLFIGTSPWMAIDYRLYHLATRYRFEETDNQSKSLTVQYFKSAEHGCRGQIQKYLAYDSQKDTYSNREFCGLYHYEQENIWTTWTSQYEISDKVTLHLNQHINYYWDQTRPFSMRRPSNNKTPWQLNSAVMAQIHLPQDFFIASEIGLLDWEKNPLHVHSSLMVGALKEGFSFHAGLSLTSTPFAFTSKAKSDYQQKLRTSGSGFNDELDEDQIKNDFSLHPELAIQFYF